MLSNIHNLQAFELKDSNLKRLHRYIGSEFYHDRTGEFDFNTLFYDIVITESATLLYCPKLLNLEKIIKESTFCIDNIERPFSIIRYSRYDCIKINQTGAKLSIKNQYFDCNWELRPFDVNRFAGKNCIVTMNKNNQLDWITDFVKFYIKHHRLDTIIIFDNASDAYQVSDLENCLTQTGVSDFLIVNTPFPYGPILANRNKSLCFLQTALLNLAKEKFLSQSNAVLSVDIDELVWTKNKTIFQMAQSSLLGVVLFKGEWRVTADNTATRHASHHYVDSTLPSCPTKYCYAPKKMLSWLGLSVHKIYLRRKHLRNILNFILTTSGAGYWHCRSISTHWKSLRDSNHAKLTVDNRFKHYFN